MELREIAAFVQMTQLKSFSKATRQLGCSQTAVTIQIKQLERGLNVRLFGCVDKQITLTYQRALFYKRVVLVMKELEHARDAVIHVSELTGSLRLGTIESICAIIFPESLKEYHGLYPKVDIRSITDSPETLLEIINGNATDIAYFLDKRMYDSKWIKALEGPEDIVFVVTSGHPFVGRDNLDLGQVMGQPFILTERNASYRFILDRCLIARGKGIHPFLEIGNVEFIINLLRENPGTSLLLEFTIHRDIISEELTVLDVRDFYMRTQCQIVYHKGKWVTREMDAFIRLTRS